MVGKIIGNDVYIHASAVETIPHGDIRHLAKQLRHSINPDIFVYRFKRSPEIRASIGVRFVEDFDKVDEPLITKSELWSVGDDGIPVLVKSRTYGSNKPVYHAKHLMVNPDYKGFDVAVYSERYAAYVKNLGGSPKNMGYSEQWDAWRIPNGF